MIEIDGSLGEGGGQVLRSALALAMLTHQPMRVYNIRALREKPGLKPQHVRAVDAAAAISHAEVRGAAPNSQDITFIPRDIHPGRYRFEIGTAGATTLVLQTIFLPLSAAGAASSVQITGGTHVPWSPSFDYLFVNWLPSLEQMGYSAKLALEQAGFYPQGGGRIDATIRPALTVTPLDWVERGALLRISGISAVANLPLEIAARQKRQALQRLSPQYPDLKIKTVELPAAGKGTFLLLLAEFERGRACYCSLGALGKPAERVADESVDGLEAFLRSGAAMDERLADQLLLPLCLAGGPSQFTTCRVTQHLLTNAEVVQKFLPAQIDIQGALGQPGKVAIHPSGKSPNS